ncbi:MAG: hypothetical protein A2268_01345 [Candidatus Raymondbacteria bacterium RifOxyA12_full_50_37]|uniref:NAD/NADP octopine/nopaline dehydrogenase n=1 Tax=Candidatus Raymondbacteria bacterium RIFOXYD12_FULL_49_13 TaxID=1817890 RepID=A0A1F7FHA8_UNCRA|nr:MAG: hypothetical protein A2268_01345 [Candidatus Raymondbacteria bacterium RifOxyA12_full_50_37]OGJ92431.1 MAG: hypothetical protein A2248_11640 [Candidatus Raymondbacteria bacterium RIFOXYA2_FULL_49_16]OGJ98852.1 MAG: hypothetical protein A2453_01070 [Candidatus Raymondbacteria bacterium RIFOXYC2_FULL_50_21]OGK03581.1 MAG: hypothetical protein A2350_09900 [Candidatus Raymondbacteria bacterium RifOxyB12_full_50_8]OGK04692.1 MAG: hypothetical protein A2487_14210 [Candidatus Raymondbacteria b
MANIDILKKPVAILGGGACAQTFAADFSLAGYTVHLFELPEFAPRMLGKVMENHEIELGGEQRNFKWFKRTGTAKIHIVTTEISEALANAGLIILAVPAKGLRPFFEKMIPFLKDGQIISIFPDNFGSMILRKMMKDKGCTAQVIIGGWSSMPYGVRMESPGKLDCIMRIRSIMWDTFPSKDSGAFIEVLKSIPPFDGAIELKQGDTIIGVDLSNPNPVIHVPGSILNVGAMEVSESEGTLGIPKGKYSMYKYGMSPAVCHVQYAFYQEEKRIGAAMGVTMSDHSKEKFYWKGSIMGFEYWVPFVDVIMPPITGPDSVNHRYFTEDIPVGTVARYHLAKRFNVDVPVIQSMITLGSIICGKDFLASGLTLDDIGIAGLENDRILNFLKQGCV